MGTVVVPERKKLLKTFNKIVNLSGITANLKVIPQEILVVEDGELITIKDDNENIEE
jgi:hypothetical protein